MGCDDNDGVLADIEQEDAEVRYRPSEKSDWIKPFLPELMIGSDRVLAGSTDAAPWIDYPGIYFIIFQDRIVYVGQASSLSARVRQHLKEGRPIARVAFIVGLPRWILDEVEYSYIRAWDTPWNVDDRRSGCLGRMAELQAAAEALDRSEVSPHYSAIVPHAALKAWQVHVLGCAQAKAADRL